LGIVTADEDTDAQGVDCQPVQPPAGNVPPVRQNGALISEAQHRRLEARINELGLDRERVKSWLAKQGVEHFPELNKQQYSTLDQMLDKWAAEVPAQDGGIESDPVFD
jgi:hypothetical protein